MRESERGETEGDIERARERKRHRDNRNRECGESIACVKERETQHTEG